VSLKELLDLVESLGIEIKELKKKTSNIERKLNSFNNIVKRLEHIIEYL